MRIRLLRLLGFIAASLSPALGYGQDASITAPARKIAEPLYILNDNIIGNGRLMTLDVNKIKSMAVYKDQSAPGLFRGLTFPGIVAITYGDKISSTSFAKLGRQHGVRAPFRVIINGQMLDATQQNTLRIAPEAIGQLRVTPATAAAPEALVDIQLVEAKPSTNHPPGTIMIR